MNKFIELSFGNIAQIYFEYKKTTSRGDENVICVGKVKNVTILNKLYKHEAIDFYYDDIKKISKICQEIENKEVEMTKEEYSSFSELPF